MIKVYGLFDFFVGIVDVKDVFRIVFQVKNVFDISFVLVIISGGFGGVYCYIILCEVDCYVGVIVRLNF